MTKKKPDPLFGATSTMISRASLAARFGMQYDGARDMFDALGYIANPTYADFSAMYEREGLAAAIADAYPSETWRRHPVLVDGEGRTDSLEKETEFTKAWRELTERLPVIRELRTLDINCNIGRYAVLFIGFGETGTATDLSTPIKTATSVEYLAAFGEGEAPIDGLVEDTRDRDYGMPAKYKLQLTASPVTVDRSRCVHSAESKRGSRVYGRPRMKLAINRLFDVEKITGGSAEALWLAMNRGLILKADEGVTMPAADSPDGVAIQEEIDAFTHKMQRYLRTKGYSAEALGVDDIDPVPAFTIAIDYLAGTLRVPKRIFIGSERGELASTQDDVNWSDNVMDRQVNFAEPDILRPFIQRCLDAGVLPKPTAGRYTVEWPSLFSLNDVEKSEVAQNYADAMNKASNGVPEDVMPLDEFSKRYMDYEHEDGNNA